MQNKTIRNWPLLWSAVKDNLDGFLIMLGMGVIFGVVGGGVFYLGFGELGAMIPGGFFALLGLALFVSAFVTTYSGIGYYYGLAMLRKHGVDVDGILTTKLADCQFHQDYDNNNRPMGEGYHYCNLLIEFDFQFNGRHYNGAFYLSKAKLFDKLQEGDPVPLKVLKLDSSVYKVRERRLANILKDRKLQLPSLIPDGAEISQLA